MTTRPAVGDTIASFIPEFPSQTNRALQQILRGRYEFEDAAAQTNEAKPKRGALYAHQKLFCRVMRVYNRMLLIAEPGTGKTLSFLAATEMFRKTGLYRGAYVLEKGDGLIDQTLKQFQKSINPLDLVRSMTEVSLNAFRRRVSQFYTFTTYGKFATDVAKMTDAEVESNFTGFVFVGDEIHNITYNPRSDRYRAFARIADLAKRTVIMLVTATPMINSREESVSLMNLLLPPERKFPEGYNFDAPGADEDIANRCLNYTSYVRAETSKVDLVEIGEPIPTQGIANVGQAIAPKATISEFGDIQAATYERVAPSFDTSETQSEPDDLDEEGSSRSNAIYNRSIQASLFVFPDGSFGGTIEGGDDVSTGGVGEGLSKYAEPLPTNEGQKWYRFKRSAHVGSVPFGRWIAGEGRPSGSPQTHNLARCSGKFARAIQEELDSFGEPGTSFVYCEAKNGGGAILFALCLEAFGYQRFDPTTADKGGKHTKARRFAIITPETSKTAREFIIETFKSPENVDGSIIKTIVGSRFSRDGLNLFHAVRIHLMQPSWTEAGALQAKMRAIRADSHDDLKAFMGTTDLIPVRLFRHAGVSPKRDVNSIDLYILRIAFEKDLRTRRVLVQMKRAAIDCSINRNRNVSYPVERRVVKNYTADCDYSSCTYKCAGSPPTADDKIYTLYGTYDIVTPADEFKEWARLFRRAFIKNPVVTPNLVAKTRNDGKQVTLEDINATELFRDLCSKSWNDSHFEPNSFVDPFMQAGCAMPIGANRAAAVSTPDLDAVARASAEARGASTMEIAYAKSPFFAMNTDLVRALYRAFGSENEAALNEVANRVGASPDEVAKVASECASSLAVLKVFERASIKRVNNSATQADKNIIAGLGSKFNGVFGRTTASEINSSGKHAFSYLSEDATIYFNTALVEEVRTAGDYSGATRVAAGNVVNDPAFMFARIFDGLDEEWRFVATDAEASAIESSMLRKASETRTATRSATVSATTEAEAQVDAPPPQISAAKELGFYGIVRRGTGKFHIVEVGLRKNAWGRVCEYFQILELIRYVLKIDKDATVATVAGAEDAHLVSAIESTINIPSIEAVDEYLTGIRELDTSKMTERRRREIYLFGRVKKPTICRYLRNQLTSLNLVVTA